MTEARRLSVPAPIVVVTGEEVAAAVTVVVVVFGAVVTGVTAPGDVECESGAPGELGMPATTTGTGVVKSAEEERE